MLKVWAERFACHSKVCARSLSPAWWHQPLIKTTFPQMSCGPQRWSTPIAQSFSDHLCSVFFQDAVLYLLSEGKNYEENHIRCYEEMWLKKKKIFPYNWSHSGEWRIVWGNEGGSRHRGLHDMHWYRSVHFLATYRTWLADLRIVWSRNAVRGPADSVDSWLCCGFASSQPTLLVFLGLPEHAVIFIALNALYLEEH